METKLIALDLDHTTLREDRSLSPANAAALARAAEKGVHVVVASGRAFSTISPEVLAIPGVRYVISGNGAAQWDSREDRCLESYVLPEDQVETIVRALDGILFEVMVDGVPYAPDYYVADPVAYGGNPRSKAFVQATRHPVPDIAAFALANRRRISWIQSYPGPGPRKDALWARLERETAGVRIASALPKLLEFYSPHCSKRSGLEFFCTYLGVDPRDTVTFGDGDNDREMMAFSGRSVAVGNAIDALKESATFVTRNSWDDGVAYALEHYLNI